MNQRRFIFCIGKKGLSFGHSPWIKVVRSMDWEFKIGRENRPGEWS